MEWRNSSVFAPVWNIRRKLAAGFSVLILIAVIAGIAIWSQLKSVSEINEALSSLNPMARSAQFLAQDVNSYLLGHSGHRQNYEQHVKSFNEFWARFVAHQEKQGAATAGEQSIMTQVQTLSEAYFDNGLKLLDTYDRQQVSLARLTGNVNQTLEALHTIIKAHGEQHPDHELLADSISNAPIELNLTGNQEINNDLRIGLPRLIADVQTYLLGDVSGKDIINQGVVNFQNSMEFFFIHLREESNLSSNYGFQIDVIQSNRLMVGRDALGLIKLRDGLNVQWLEVNGAGESLDDLISDLVRIHNDEIAATRADSSNFAIFVIIVAILVGIGASIFIGNMITDPIIALNTAVREFGQGIKGDGVEVKSGDEIGELGLAFNQMAEDITEHQTELSDLRDEQLRSERLATLTKLIAAVSHELRNPLGTIRTAVYSIGKRLEGQNAGVTKILHRAENSVNRCDDIIEVLLDFTRTPALIFEPTRIDDWIEKVLSELTIDPSINIIVKLDSGTTAAIDRKHFQSSFVNVVNNASQAILESEEQGASGNITVKTFRDNAEVIVEVSDTGPGIITENLDKIFEPMFSTRAYGVGLGLPIVKKVMDQHHGEVKIDSQTGGGTTVTLRLPIDRTEEN
jgi:signal transduction histidine kinase